MASECCARARHQERQRAAGIIDAFLLRRMIDSPSLRESIRREILEGQPEGEGTMERCTVAIPEGRCPYALPCPYHPAPQPSEPQGARLNFLDPGFDKKLQAMKDEVRASERITAADLQTRIGSGEPQGEKPAETPAEIAEARDFAEREIDKLAQQLEEHCQTCPRISELDAQLAEAKEREMEARCQVCNQPKSSRSGHGLGACVPRPAIESADAMRDTIRKREAEVLSIAADLDEANARLAAQEKALEAADEMLDAGEFYSRNSPGNFARFSQSMSAYRALRPEVGKPEEPKPATCSELVEWRGHGHICCDLPLPCERHPK